MKAAIDNDLSPLTWPFAYMPTKITIRMSSQNASHQSENCKNCNGDVVAGGWQYAEVGAGHLCSLEKVINLT